MAKSCFAKSLGPGPRFGGLAPWSPFHNPALRLNPEPASKINLARSLQFFTDQYSPTMGPRAPALQIAGKSPNTKVFVQADVFILNPGLPRGTTQFIIAQPFVETGTGNNPGPFGATTAGVNDTFFSAEAVWKFGEFHRPRTASAAVAPPTGVIRRRPARPTFSIF
jgi:hypothetical protein